MSFQSLAIGLQIETGREKTSKKERKFDELSSQEIVQRASDCLKSKENIKPIGLQGEIKESEEVQIPSWHYSPEDELYERNCSQTPKLTELVENRERRDKASQEMTEKIQENIISIVNQKISRLNYYLSLKPSPELIKKISVGFGEINSIFQKLDWDTPSKKETGYKKDANGNIKFRGDKGEYKLIETIKYSKPHEVERIRLKVIKLRDDIDYLGRISGENYFNHTTSEYNRVKGKYR